MILVWSLEIENTITRSLFKMKRIVSHDTSFVKTSKELDRLHTSYITWYNIIVVRQGKPLIITRDPYTTSARDQIPNITTLSPSFSVI